MAILPFALGLQNSQSISSYGKIEYSDGQTLLKLHVDGTEIKDSNGNVVKLRGFAATAYHLDSRYQLTEEDVSWIASKGFNVVRLYFYWSEFEKTQGVYDVDGYLGYFDRAIDWCEKYGIYVIFDQHTSPYKWREEWWFRGFPTFYTDVYASDWDCTLDFMILNDPTGTGQGRVMRDALTNMVKFIAARYAGRNVIAGYSLMNEPYGVLGDKAPVHQDIWGAGTDGRPYCYMQYLNEELGPTIRSKDPSAILFFNALDSYWWNTKPTLLNVAFGDSYYIGSYQDWSPQPYDKGRKQEMTEWLTGCYNHYVGTLGVPWIAFEFGAGMELDNNKQWVQDWLALMSAQFKIHWMYWRYSRGEENGWAPRNTDGSDTELVAILQSHINP